MGNATVTLLARTWSGEEAGRARIEVPGVITVDWQRMSDMRGYPPQESLFVPEHLIADLDLTPRALRVVSWHVDRQAFDRHPCSSRQ